MSMRSPRLTALWFSFLLLLTGAVASGRGPGVAVSVVPSGPMVERHADPDATPLLRAERVAAPTAHAVVRVARTSGGLGQRPGPAGTLAARWSTADGRVERRTSHAVAARGGVLPYFPTAPPVAG